MAGCFPSPRTKDALSLSDGLPLSSWTVTLRTGCSWSALPDPSGNTSSGGSRTVQNLWFVSWKSGRLVQFTEKLGVSQQNFPSWPPVLQMTIWDDLRTAQESGFVVPRFPLEK